MTPERWAEVERLYHAALARSGDARATFLADACAGDASLRQEVESLLAQASGEAGFLSTPAAARAGELLGDGPSVIGRQLGPYTIVERLGAGGMGEVYRARDNRLGREVAIKILPQIFTSDPNRLARFEREARALASLNHPHIGAIYGLENLDGTPALVLELVEGDTLAERIEKGKGLKAQGSGLPVAETLDIAKQITEAIEAAHERGIVHRDLKPSNIKITPAGVVKVLDFGLAKAAAGDTSNAGVSQPAGIKTGGTREGAILGTAAYMSPEQARGHAVDKRTDIWAFGCVLYEMLTGRRAFEGDSATEILARVIEREPDWTALSPALYPRIRELLRACLEKDPKMRRRDMGDVRIEIEHVLSGRARTAAPIVEGTPRERAWLVWVVATVLAAALAVAIARPYFTRPAEAPETRLDVSVLEMPDPSGFAISPDGRRLAFAAVRSGRHQLYVRSLSLDADTARPLSGTDAATLPFWSPDSRSIGFFAGGQLKRVDLDGGLVQTLANAAPGWGGTWGPNGVIVFAPGAGPLFQVPASVGETVAITKISAGQSSHTFPWFIPGSRQFLFYAAGTEDAQGIYIGSLDSTDTSRIAAADAAAAYLSPGWLLYGLQGSLVARRFDVARRDLSGESVTVSESVWVGAAHGAFSVSSTGVIAYRTGGINPRQLTWFDRSGRTHGTFGELNRAGQLNVALSPDGQRAAVQRTIQNNTDIWLIDSAREIRFTTDAGGDGWARWSPDGTRIAYVSNQTTPSAVYQKAANGAGPDERLVKGLTCDWSPDGRFLLYIAVDPKTRGDLWVLPLHGDRKPFPLLATSAIEQWGQFSPDGRWVAYQSNESGRFETYVRPFPGPGGQWPVSTSGGIQPRWRRDGKELYYLAPDGKLMAASIDAKGATLAVTTPVALFQPHIVGGGTWFVGNAQQYDVAPNGRFLVNVETESGSPPVTLVLNWKPKQR
jgi:Tol biopolymer transport system component